MSLNFHAGRRLKRIRTTLKLTQSQMAAAVGIKQEAISYMEGREVMPESSLVKLSDFLESKNINPDYLLRSRAPLELSEVVNHENAVEKYKELKEEFERYRITQEKKTGEILTAVKHIEELFLEFIKKGEN